MGLKRFKNWNSSGGMHQKFVKIDYSQNSRPKIETDHIHNCSHSHGTDHTVLGSDGIKVRVINNKCNY